MSVLSEVVLYNPIDVAMAPWIKRAPTPQSKDWVKNNLRNWLLKSQSDLHKLAYLPPNATPQQKKAFEYDDLYDVRLSLATENMLEHVMDFFDNNKNLPRLARMSVADVVNAADLWVKQLQKQGAKQQDDPKQVQTIMEFPQEGYKVVNLIGKEALQREGSLMGHCVGGESYLDYVKKGQGYIYSLRDYNNNPHATMEVTKDKRTEQIKGRSNEAPVRRYWPMLRMFFEKSGITVAHDYLNVGLIDVDDERMTMDQFKDMVLDPNNPRGAELIIDLDYKLGLMTTDMVIGLFSALYGTDHLSDKLVKMAFGKVPEMAIQTVQHYGNKLTPEQQVLAFTHLPIYLVNIEILEKNIKALLIAIKPSMDVIREIEFGNNSTKEDIFLVCLASVFPEQYKEYVGNNFNTELESRVGKRRAAPFFAYIGTRFEGIDPETVNRIIQGAFLSMPEEALKKLKSTKYMLNTEEALVVLRALGYNRKLDSLLETLRYLMPIIDSSFIETVLEQFKGKYSKDFYTILLVCLRRLVPSLLNKDIVEQFLLEIHSVDGIRDYLKTEPHPGLEFQNKLFEWSLNKDRGFVHALRWISVIDPQIYAKIYGLLKPEAIPTTKKGFNTAKQKEYVKKLTQQEKNKAYAEARNKAIDRFCQKLGDALIQDSDTTILDPDPDSPKFKAAQDYFAKIGKLALFDTAVKKAERQIVNQRLGDYGSDWSFHDFEKNISKYRISDIISLLDRKTKKWFGMIINAYPKLTPLLMRGYYAKSKGSYHNHNGVYWKDFRKWAFMNKEKSLEAMEYVWADPKVPAGYKDSFSLEVLKRFKPKNEEILRILKMVDNEVAVRYILKKTKKPSAEFVDYVAGFPDLMLESMTLDMIPQPSLEKLFKDDFMLASNLMVRDATVDHTSPVFKRYEEAAKAAGKKKEFEKIVHQSELDKRLFRRNGDEDDSEEAAKTAFFNEHLDEFNNATLLRYVTKGFNFEVVKTYLNKFDVKKITALIENGLLDIRGLYGYYGVEGKENYTYFKSMNRSKLTQLIDNICKQKKQRAMESLLSAVVQREKMRLSDDETISIIKAFHNTKSGVDAVSILDLKNVGNDVKNTVADLIPEYMARIKKPTPHMISKLFETYGKIDKNGTINYFFKNIVSSWFNQGDISFKYKPNPDAERYLKAEAMERRGIALDITLAMFREFKKVENQNDTHFYFGNVKVKLMKTPKKDDIDASE